MLYLRTSARDVLQTRAGGLLGLRVHEAKPAGTLQGTAFRSRNHRLVRALLSPVRAQFPEPGGINGGAQCQRRPRHDLALGPEIRPGTTPTLPLGTADHEPI